MRHERWSSPASTEEKEEQEHFVYVVDDELPFRRSSCFLIGALGLTCFQYPDGATFLRDVETLKPGCVLLDVFMEPVGGLEVQNELLRRGIDWPIVFMSGASDVPIIVEAVRKGAVEFLEKPFTEEELLAALHRGFVKLRSSEARA